MSKWTWLALPLLAGAMFDHEALRVLGLERGATDAEIKKAYRRLSLQHHPDKGGNADDFVRIHEAYETLSRGGGRSGGGGGRSGGGSGTGRGRGSGPNGAPFGPEDALYAALFRFEAEFGERYANFTSAWNATRLREAAMHAIDRRMAPPANATLLERWRANAQRQAVKSAADVGLWFLNHLDLERLAKSLGEALGAATLEVNGQRVDLETVKRRYRRYAEERRRRGGEL